MTTATLSTPANQDRSHAEDIIRAVYRQVFGNRHLMEPVSYTHLTLPTIYSV